MTITDQKFRIYMQFNSNDDELKLVVVKGRSRNCGGGGIWGYSDDDIEDDE